MPQANLPDGPQTKLIDQSEKTGSLKPFELNWGRGLLARSYLRASTSEQDATRARAAVESFAAEHGLMIAATYIENESGATLVRPRLWDAINDSRPGDVLLVEQVDRLSRLTEPDWRRLRSEIDARQVRVVALDLPTSWMLAAPGDEFTGRMFAAMNSMLLDVLAAVSRKDYIDRRRRQAEGQAKARAEGKYKGRPEDAERNRLIATMLSKSMSWSEVQAATKCSRATVAKRARAEAVGEARVG